MCFFSWLFYMLYLFLKIIFFYQIYLESVPVKQSALVTKTRKEISHQEPSINAQLLERAGYVSKLMAGVYSYLPLGLKVLTAIEDIIREEMNELGAQEVLMPALHPRENWDTTKRWDSVDVLYKLKGVGDRDLALGATHEEVVTPLMSAYIQSYKDLPKAVYQIQTKFRNEARSKSGLLRGREFRMKDLYSFHATQEDLDVYYEIVLQAYHNIFKRCGLGETTYLTYASGGSFSKYSHEFQTVTQYGEDIIHLCSECRIAINSEIFGEQNNCPSCKNTQLLEHKAIEVGNIFKLSTRFSEPFKTQYTDASGNSHDIIMGCYGIGPSRLMGTIVETLHDDKGIIWPEEIAPFQVHLISLLKETEPAQALYKLLQENNVSVLYDDRADLRPGEKFADADLLGMPYRVVISAKTLAQNAVELKARNSNDAQLISQENLIELLKNKKAVK